MYAAKKNPVLPVPPVQWAINPLISVFGLRSSLSIKSVGSTELKSWISNGSLSNRKFWLLEQFVPLTLTLQSPSF